MTTARERRIVDAELRVHDAPGGSHRVIGYAAVFNLLSLNLGGFRERIAPGAFAKALRSADVPLLIEHRDLALADTETGTLRLSEDRHGLKIDADLDPDDPDANRVVPKLRRGTLRSMSFAFRIASGGDKWDNQDGELIRTIIEVKELFDVSLVTQPAYPDTSAALRSLEAWRGSGNAPARGRTIAELQQRLERQRREILGY